jgi:ribosomal protein L30/L7E
MGLIEIQLVRGAANNKQRKTLTALGLKRIGDNKWVADEPAAQYDEEQDAGLVRNLVFGPNGITLERYGDFALKLGKTPDFKLLKDGTLHGFCEVKSPRDDYVFDVPNESGFAVRENVPTRRKLGSHIRQASNQFEAVNPGHKLPNILVFVKRPPARIAARQNAATSPGGCATC